MKSNSVFSPKDGGRAPVRAKQKEPDAQERAVLVTLFAQGSFTEAMELARHMTRQYPRHGLGWKALGASLKRLGHTQEALPPSQKATQLMPRDHEAFNNLGVVFKDLGRVAQAVACFRHALDLKDDFADAWGNLGGALREQGQLVEALKCYRRKALLMPSDPEVHHHVAALAGDAPDRAPQGYVAGVFDHYAAHFESHLQKALQYDMPAKLHEALRERLAARPGAVWRVLDLGCGTGLMAAPLAPHAREMVGVDLSGKMLAQAECKGLYQRLAQADIVTMMQGEQAASYDLIVAADVFVYLGDLDEVFAQASRLLADGGVFAFSAEGLHEGQAPDGRGFKLNTSGRYAHTQAGLRQWAQAHGLRVETMETTTQRFDQGVPLWGYLAVLAPVSAA